MCTRDLHLKWARALSDDDGDKFEVSMVHEIGVVTDWCYVKKELDFMIFLKSGRKPLIKEALEH
jgi:hypothetical protein